MRETEYTICSAREIATLWGSKAPVSTFAGAIGLPYRTVTGYISRGFFPITCWENIIFAARRDKKKVVILKNGREIRQPIDERLLFDIWLSCKGSGLLKSSGRAA